MRKVLSTLFVLVAMAGIAASQQPPAAQEQPGAALQDPRPAPAQQEATLKTAEGALSKVDAQMESIWIKTKDGKEMQFSYNKDTKVEGATQTVEGLAGMSGRSLKVHYRSEASTNVAVRIEVLAGTA